MSDIDSETLAAVFASRVALAKKTEDEAVAEIRTERLKAIQWAESKSQAQFSFLWCCDFFDMEPSAVRRAIREKRK